MTILLMIRHGQSITNINKAFTGQYDADLTELGYKQAEKAAEFIIENFIVDEIYSSDLKRAYNTAKEVAKRINKDIIDSKNLREIYAGPWQNMKYSDIKESYPEYYEVWMNDIGKSKCPEGESVGELADRVMKELRMIAESNMNKTILIATHATPIRILQTISEKGKLDEMSNVKWVPNASLTALRYEKGKFEIMFVGEDKYLEKIRTEIPIGI